MHALQLVKTDLVQGDPAVLGGTLLVALALTPQVLYNFLLGDLQPSNSFSLLNAINGAAGKQPGLQRSMQGTSFR